MLVTNKKAFNKGLFLAVTFFAVLFLMFSPIFGEGRNAFHAADRLYNSIAKGSTYYIPGVMKTNEEFKGHNIDVSIKLDDELTVQRASELFSEAGATVSAEGNDLRISGDLGRMLETPLKHADAVFHNEGDDIAQQFGYPQREVLYVWYKSLKEIARSLTRQEKFADAAWIDEVLKRTIEVSYNFYKIEPRSAVSAAGILTFSLGFYVLYTMWYGYAILYMFEGIGLEMKAGKKKEV